MCAVSVYRLIVNEINQSLQCSYEYHIYQMIDCKTLIIFVKFHSSLDS